jgi:hypothetical protein
VAALAALGDVQHVLADLVEYLRRLSRLRNKRSYSVILNYSAKVAKMAFEHIG